MSARRKSLVEIEDPAVREAVVAALQDSGHETVVGGPGLPPALDVLVVDTPLVAVRDLLGGDVERWYDDVHAAVTRPFQSVRAATPALRRSGDARVIVLGSGWLPTSVPHSTAAAAAHGAVVALVKTLARDLGPQGITVNEVVLQPAEPVAPEHVARAVAYLAGSHGGAVTGQLLTIGLGGELRP